MLKCAWSSVACAEMCMHGAVACACHQNVGLTGSIAQLKDTDLTRSYDTKSILLATTVHFLLTTVLCMWIYQICPPTCRCSLTLPKNKRTVMLNDYEQHSISDQ